jgi:hypothetical protein
MSFDTTAFRSLRASFAKQLGAKGCGGEGELSLEKLLVVYGH